MEVKGQLITSSSYSSSEALPREVCPRLRLERVQELVERQRLLHQVLSLRLKELRRVCLQEAELTGKLPPEYPLEPGERPQLVRRRPAPLYRIANVPKAEVSRWGGWGGLGLGAAESGGVPSRTLPRSTSSFEGRSVPATPVLTRNALGSGLRPRQWTGSQDSQLGPPSRDTSADRASLFTARTRRSNSSEALIERCSPEDPPLPPSGPPFKSTETLNPPGLARGPRPPYADLLLDYYLERQCWGGSEHLSRRDGPPQLEWGGYPSSPLQRRARPAARTKSCGPLLPPQAPREAVYAPPAPSHRTFHKALALEGLRDWYLRNAGSGQRGAPERRGLGPLPPQQRVYYELGFYGGPRGLPHSLSYAGQPLHGRYGACCYPPH
uniref:Coiled-coil domain containing 120 n=1 Tax=Sphenodon punctatus TaxID=8508 RepID=A0A8D0L427_SPHPU